MFGQRSDGPLFEITLEVLAPRLVGTQPEEWACQVEIRPLPGGHYDPHGASSLQALTLAIRAGLWHLQHFSEEGGVLLFETGSPFDFGPFLVELWGKNGDA